jgi:predicted RNA-binding protein YlqC (UPF0109 family)
MKNLLQFLVSHIVEHPGDVNIEEQVPGEGFLNLALKVHQEDVGLIIGKKGNTIRALKNILRIKGLSERVRVNIEITND